MDYKKYYKKPYKKKTTAPKVEYKPQRGKLAPLMTEDLKKEAGIHELSYDFGCRITRLFQYLTEDSEYKEYVISKQIYRCGTSIGANVRESKHAQSDADLTVVDFRHDSAKFMQAWLCARCSVSS